MKKINRYFDRLRIRESDEDSPAQTRARHQTQVSLPYSSTAAPSPSLLTRPGSATLTDSRSEGSLIKHARHWIGKKLTHRMSFAQLPIKTADHSM